MSIVQPLGPRTQVEQTPEGLRITIKARRVWPVILFLSFWLCGWAAGEGFVLVALARGVTQALGQGPGGEKATSVGGMGFMLLWLCIWTVGGVLALACWIYLLAGAEVIEVDSQGLTRRFRPLAFPRPRRYLAARISNLSAINPPPESEQRSGAQPPWSRKFGRIAFSYAPEVMNPAEQAEAQEPAVRRAEAKPPDWLVKATGLRAEGLSLGEGERPTFDLNSVFLGSDVDADEAKAIVDTILGRYPDLGRGGEREEKW